MTGEQLGMVALFHDLTVVDEADFIRVLDGGKPVPASASATPITPAIIKMTGAPI